MVTPKVVLVHGTWHGAWCWSDVVERLERQGLASIAPVLTGMGERFAEAAEGVGVDTHVGDVAASLEKVTGPVVLVGHSYGAIPVWGAASAAPTRVRGVVNIDGFLARNGVSAFDLLPALQTMFDRRRLPDRPWLLAPLAPAELGITDQLQAETVAARLTPAPIRTHSDPLRMTGEPWTGPRVYIWARRSASAEAPAIAHRAEREGWVVRDLPGGHDLMVVNPDGVADLIATFVQTVA